MLPTDLELLPEELEELLEPEEPEEELLSEELPFTV